MKTIREFKYKKSLVQKNLLLSGFIILISLVLLYATEELIMPLFITGIVLFFITVIKSKHRIIKIFENHFELRQNVFSPIKSIQNKCLVDYTLEDNKLIISYISYDGTADTYTIFENKIEKNDFDDFLLFLITIKEENSIRVIHNLDKNSVLKEAI